MRKVFQFFQITLHGIRVIFLNFKTLENYGTGMATGQSKISKVTSLPEPITIGNNGGSTLATHETTFSPRDIR